MNKFIATLFFCSLVSLLQAQAVNPAVGEITNEIFKTVEENPRFPGCEHLAGDEQEMKNCSDEKMLEFIYVKIKYPIIARETGIEGIVVITFVVEKDGSISNEVIARDIGSGCGLEALRVVRLMPRWIPGKENGEPVRVQFNLPVKYKLEDPIEATEPDYVLPFLPACAKLTDELERKNCSDSLLEFIYTHIQYPEKARKKGIEGTVMLSVTVNETGFITNIIVEQDIGGGCGKAASRALEQLPVFIPGKADGKNATMVVHVPVVFKLE